LPGFDVQMRRWGFKKERTIRWHGSWDLAGVSDPGGRWADLQNGMFAKWALVIDLLYTGSRRRQF
jgi:hypothetical protein